MSGTSFMKYLAFVLMTLFAIVGGLFAAGYAIDDPGGWTAVAIIASSAVPAIVLSVLALVRPRVAGIVLVVLAGAVVAFTVVDALVGITPRDSWGPVGSVSVLMLAAAVGFLGLHRPTLAGWLLIGLGVGQAIAAVTTRHGGDGAVPLRAALSGSTGVVVVPLLVIGVLFLISARWGRAATPAAAAG